MPPRKQFTKEQILEAAFKIIEEQGLANLTIRKVAKELNCSVAPIYVNFENSDELIKTLIDKVSKIAIDMMSEKYTENNFLNTGIGHLKFVLKYGTLYKDLLQTGNDAVQFNINKEKFALDQMKKDKWFKDFTDDEIYDIFLKMRVFVYGLASMHAHNLFTINMSEEEMIKLITESGNDIVYSAKVKKLNKRAR